MHKHEIIIYWSSEDEVFVGEVPELPGCMAHDETQEAALKAVDEAGICGLGLRGSLGI